LVDKSKHPPPPHMHARTYRHIYAKYFRKDSFSFFCFTFISVRFTPQVLVCLRKQVHHTRQELFPEKSILCYDNVPSQKVLYFEEFWAKKLIVLQKHPTYSSDLIPHDFFLFHTIKNDLNRTHFHIRSKRFEVLQVPF
jgi:hypothetical protein